MTDFWQSMINAEHIENEHTPLQASAIYPLEQFSHIEVIGPDAEKFLQGQLSCDVTKLTLHQSGLGSHSTAKGRMLSSFRICKIDEQRFLLRIHQSIQEQALAALRKYIVFSKAEAFINDEYIAFGIHDPSALDAIQKFWPNIVFQEYQQSSNDRGVVLVSSIDFSSFEIYTTKQQAKQLWQVLSNQFKTYSSTQHQLLENQLGLAFVEHKSFEKFTPQTYNYQLTPAISFKKGCYTGQEIVARLHYLGKLKRHTYHYIVETESFLKVAGDISLENSEKSIGNILSAVQIGDNHWDILVNLVEEYAAINNFNAQGKMLNVIQHLEIAYDKATN